jgi:hypothetical protein
MPGSKGLQVSSITPAAPPPEIIHEAWVYLNAAIQALRYVQSKMDIGASNKLPESLIGWPARMMCVAESRDQMVKDLKMQEAELKRTQGDPMKAMVDTWASWARFYGCGNCGEQSALAFVQLRDVWKTFPLDWMQYESFRHAFVVLGRIGVTDTSNVETWNTEAVVCDPWQGEATVAADARWLIGKNIRLLYRLAG